VKEKISTIFLDGKAVDSPETALLREGSTLALSSAMPGLAGAILRRDGPYASLRSSITIESLELKDFIARQGPDFRIGCLSVLLDGRAVDGGTLLSGNQLTEKGDMELRVHTK